MQVFQDWTNLPATQAVVMTIGVFDGVHVGHQQLVRRVVARARQFGRQAVVVTFHPHPRSVVAPGSSWGYICSLEERLARIAELGPDLAVVLPFTPALADTSAEQFVEDLCRRIPLRELHVGGGFFLGRGGQGDLALLRSLGQRWNFAVEELPPVLLDGRVVSSTHIRECIQAGEVAEVRRWLGRLFSLSGPVVSGAGLGRTLGFPTANLQLHPRQVLPADGVYAAWARFAAASPWPALVYVGRRPTFDDGQRMVEVHLLDFSADLIGHELRLEFLQYLRPDQTFAGPAELVAQIQRDAVYAREVFRSPPA